MPRIVVDVGVPVREQFEFRFFDGKREHLVVGVRVHVLGVVARHRGEKIRTADDFVGDGVLLAPHAHASGNIQPL